MPNRTTPRGRNIPDWLKNRIRQIQLKLRDDHPTGREPSTPQVRKELAEYLNDRATANETELYPLPSVSAVFKILKARKLPGRDLLDGPWSLGKSESNGLPDEATGALLTMWRFAKTDLIPMPFTIRMARWVCKLRWVPEAGGSPNGEVIKPDQLYVQAARYSGRERKVEMIKDEKGMRSEVLDAQLMFSLPAIRVAQRLGVLENADGIDYQDELAIVSPHLAAAASVARNTEPLQLSDAEMAYLVERSAEFGESKPVALELLSLGILALSRDPRQQRLTKEQVKACVVAMLEDLVRAYKEGGIDDWNPPLDALLEPYLE
jgi:hypothetical protein